MGLSDNFTPVGTRLDGLWIVSQYDKETKENFMWIGELLNFEDDYEKLSMDFTTWLERFIICQGCSFWLDKRIRQNQKPAL